jgi:hypothetical protein
MRNVLIAIAALMLVGGGNSIAGDSGGGPVPPPIKPPSLLTPTQSGCGTAFGQSDLAVAIGRNAFPSVVCAAPPPPPSDATMTIIRNLKGVDYKVLRGRSTF